MLSFSEISMKSYKKFLPLSMSKIMVASFMEMTAEAFACMKIEKIEKPPKIESKK